MINLASRNLKIFFRQKNAVFFSMMGVLIILGLYLVFLGNVWADYLPDGLPGVGALRDNWFIAGIVPVTSATAAMGAFEIMVEDRVRKNIRDFEASPVRRSTLVGGYLLSSSAVGAIMSLFAFALGELFIALRGEPVLSAVPMLECLGVLLLSVLASDSLVFFLVGSMQSASAFSTASTVLETLIGFLTGMYLPAGTLPEPVQWAIKLFPISHAAALMRQIMLKEPTAVSFAGAPEGAAAEFREFMGVTLTYNGHTATAAVHVAVLGGTFLLFFLLALWKLSRKRKE